MKIAIISSGNDSLALFRFLSKFEHEYLIYFDSLHAPYGEKSLLATINAVQDWILRAKKNGAEKIILPPLYELFYLLSEQKNEDKNLILPLFSSYLLEEVFPRSLVWKLGIFGEKQILSDAQMLIYKLATSYQPTQAQQQIKKFSFPFRFRAKDTTIFAHLLQKIWRKSFLVNTIIKNDLRYFKDAAVDTLIPLNYAYFHAETTMSKFLNFKKIKFHRLSALQRQFERLISAEQTSAYSVKIHATDTNTALVENKRLLWLLQRGKSIEIERC